MLCLSSLYFIAIMFNKAVLTRQVIKLNRTLRGTILQHKKFGIKDVLLIVSSPRGGSTWLTEIINNLPDTAINWEPFHPRAGAVPALFEYGSDLDFDLANVDAKLNSHILDALTARLYSNFTMQFCSLKDCWAAATLITKSIRITAALPWICDTYEFALRPLYLVRHPIPTALSHLKAFGQRCTHPRDFFLPSAIKRDSKWPKYLKYLQSLQSPLELEVAIWCINNFETLRIEHEQKKWMTIYYEQLLMNPKTEFVKILDAIGQNGSKIKQEDIDFLRPSQTDMDRDMAKNGEAQLRKWQGKLARQELTRIQKILDEFNIIEYNVDSALPLTNTAEVE